MLYQITDGTISLGGNEILAHINFEIKGTEKIALVGKNGAGKTTLLRLIAGELSLDRDDKRDGKGIFTSRKLTVGLLHQQAFADQERTVEQELLDACPCRDTFDQERYLYEMEYDRLFVGFGFEKADKYRRIGEFSGGEQTKIGMIRLFLQKPDILLLDEPTNHLDFQTVEWLEEYLQQYDRAVVMVSHDRFFLDRTAEVVYELELKKLTRYVGNYSWYRREKQRERQRQLKAYEQQQQEIRRLEDLIERFKHKPKKAAFARAKKKQLERIERIGLPEGRDVPMMTGAIVPEVLGSKLVVTAEHLVIGYDQALAEISLRIRRGQKIGIIGPNGAGKTALLKTIAGYLPPLKGRLRLGNQIVMGYFDQLSADIESEKTVLQEFHDEFPALTKKDARSILGRYLFGGEKAAQPVRTLSGGEKARLKLAGLLQRRPNFLLLDEPTNHMDIQAREVLEAALQAYTGTMLFVSHDRYFLNEVADTVLIFEPEAVMYYPFGYQHYLERRSKKRGGGAPAAQMRAEEQALVSGLRAVPKAERHRLKELAAEEIYLDWQLRLAGERMEACRQQAEQCFGKIETVLMHLHLHETDDAEMLQLKAEYEEICSAWTDSCVVWYDLEKQISAGDCKK